MTTARKRALRRGRWAEHAAAMMLRLKGYRILGMRVKTPVGEIDLIARKRGTCVFVEVKLRRTLEGAKAAILRRQQARVARAAQWWLKGKSGHAHAMRFDVICVASTGAMTHIRSAWDAPQ